jgi:hypothetical protein
MSKEKGYKLSGYIRRSPAYDPTASAAMIKEKESQPAINHVDAAQQAVDLASLRLAAMREMLLKETGSSSLSSSTPKR